MVYLRWFVNSVCVRVCVSMHRHIYGGLGGLQPPPLPGSGTFSPKILAEGGKKEKENRKKIVEKPNMRERNQL